MQINRQKFITLIQKLIFVNFNLLFFLTPFVFTWMNQELFEFSKMLFVYFMTIVLVSLWLIRMIAEQKVILKKSKFDYVVLAFLASQIISTIFSLHMRTSWFGYYTRFNGGLLSTITYIALYYTFVSNIKKAQIQAIYNSLFLSALMISFYAIPEHFGHSPSCYLVAKKFDVSCWVQDVQNRVFATFGQPNWLAAFLISLIPLNVDKIIKEKNLLNRLYLILVLSSSVIALLFSKSRSGLLGLIIGLGFYALFKIFANKKDRLNNSLKLGGVTLLIAVLTLFIGTPYTPKISDLIKGKTEISASASGLTEIQTGGTPSEEIRKIVWQGAIKVWQHYPIFGSGVETFAYSYYLDRPVAHNLVSEWDFLYNKAHNELLNYLANSGLVGLLSYLALFAMIFYLGLKHYLGNKNYSELLAILAGIIAMFVSNFFGFSTVATNVLLFGFFAIIVLDEKDKEENNLADDKNADKKDNLSNNEYYIYTLIVIGALILISKVWTIWEADYLFTKGQSAFEKGNYQAGLPIVQQAIKKSPKEAFFYDELASDYAQLSIAFANENQSTASTQLAQSAIESNRFALSLNPVHLNFYKSQARIYIRLGQLDPRLYSYAKQSLEKAITLAPTDAKLYYNLALVLEIMGEKENALKNMEYAVSIKSNYLQARGELARMYFSQGELEKARDQYIYSLEKIAPNDELVKEKLKIVEASLSSKILKK